MRLSPNGVRVLSLFIHASSVRSLLLIFPVVCVRIIAVTSSMVWLAVVKWCETGFMTFPCLMSVKWALNRSLKVFPDWPTYCRPHFEHESK